MQSTTLPSSLSLLRRKGIGRSGKGKDPAPGLMDYLGKPEQGETGQSAGEAPEPTATVVVPRYPGKAHL